MLTVRELYVRLDKKVGLNSLYDAIRRGQIKSFKIGRKILVPTSEVEDYVKRMVA